MLNGIHIASALTIIPIGRAILHKQKLWTFVEINLRIRMSVQDPENQKSQTVHISPESWTQVFVDTKKILSWKCPSHIEKYFTMLVNCEGVLLIFLDYE